MTLATAAALVFGAVDPAAAADSAVREKTVGAVSGNLAGAEVRVGGIPLAELADGEAPVPLAGEDLVVDIDLGDDPELNDVVMNGLRDEIDRIQGKYPVVSDYFDEVREKNRIDGIEAESRPDGLRFDADITVEGRTVTGVVPASEVQTESGFWEGVGISLASWTIGTVAGLVCLYGLKYAPVCGFITGFVITFFDNLFTALVNKEELDHDKWADIMGRSLYYGVVGISTGIAGQKYVPDLLNWISRKAKDVAGTVRVLKAFADWGFTISRDAAAIFRKLQGGLRSGAQIRLMPLGDSITYGVASSDRNGYRDELYAYLKMTADVDFVGSVQSGGMSDPDNEGHSGDRIDEIAGFAGCSVPQYQPNVIALHAGTNDMNQNYQLSTAPARIEKLIDRALQDSPRATVLVAKIIPTGKAGLQPRIDAYNAALPGVVRSLQDQGKHVLLVDMDRVVVSDGLQNDAHPTDRGYAKMAGAWYEGVLEADANGWITAPMPQRAPTGCDPGRDPQPVEDGDGPSTDPGGTALGEGWRKLGVIAPGYGGTPGRTIIAELNGDRRADYLQVYPDGSFRASVNTVGTPGRPDWVDVGRYDIQAEGEVRFADLNGDGRDDYLQISPNSAVRAFLNLDTLDEGSAGDSGSARRLKFTYWGVVFDGMDIKRDHLRFADVNGDGRDDILRVSDTGRVHAYFNMPEPGGSRPTWVEKLSWAPGVSGATLDNLQFADVDNDDRADYLMVGTDGSVHAYLNRGGKDAGGFEGHHDFARASDYPREYIRFKDISGDGKADYLVVYNGGAVRAWLNRGGNL